MAEAPEWQAGQPRGDGAKPVLGDVFSIGLARWSAPVPRRRTLPDQVFGGDQGSSGVPDAVDSGL
jgi:hypothetical protein